MTYSRKEPDCFGEWFWHKLLGALQFIINTAGFAIFVLQANRLQDLKNDHHSIDDTGKNWADKFAKYGYLNEDYSIAMMSACLSFGGCIAGAVAGILLILRSNSEEDVRLSLFGCGSVICCCFSLLSAVLDPSTLKIIVMLLSFTFYAIGFWISPRLFEEIKNNDFKEVGNKTRLLEPKQKANCQKYSTVIDNF